METYIKKELLNEVIRAYDIIESGGVHVDSSEKKDGVINLFFKVKSRTEKEKEPYWVGLPLKKRKGSEKEYEIEIEESTHPLCPEYDRSLICHHILVAAIYATRQFREIKKSQGLKGIRLVSKYRPLPQPKNL